jgi:predicted Zn-dependent protease
MTGRDRFYDGRTAKPHAVSIALTTDVLVLRSAEEQRQLACWVIAEMLAVDSNDLNGEMTFRQLTDPEARLILAPSPIRDQLLDQAPHLKHWQRRQRRAVGRTIGILTLGGIAILLGCYFGLPRLAIALVDVMPLSIDRKLGDPVRAGIVNHARLCRAPAGQAALDALGARLLPDSIAALPLTLDVIDSKEVNAFALPGNHIIVYSGLIAEAETPEMLAGVLAHEMGHLEMRHPTRGIVEQLGLSAAVNLLAGNNAISNVGQVMAGLSYSRDMERQADGRAIALLHRAAIRADGLAAFFARLKQDEKLHLPALLSDHPGLDERARATEQDTTGGPAMSGAEWKAVKAICQP